MYVTILAQKPVGSWIDHGLGPGRASGRPLNQCSDYEKGNMNLTKSISISFALFVTLAPLQTKAQGVWASMAAYALQPGWISAGAAVWAIRGDYEASSLTASVFTYTSNLKQLYRTNTWTSIKHYYVGQDNLGHFEQSGTYSNGQPYDNFNAFDFDASKSSYSCYSTPPSDPMGSTVTTTCSFQVLHHVYKTANNVQNISKSSGPCAIIFTYNTTPKNCGDSIEEGKVKISNTSYNKNDYTRGLMPPASDCLVTSYYAAINVPY